MTMKRFIFLAFFLSACQIIGTSGFAQEIIQPINFLHQTHVALNDLSCEFCHIYARRSKISGVPPVRICAGCHIHLKGTVSAQSNEIRKITEKYWNKQRPIPWKKYHDLPDFIDFSHQAHVLVGFDCTDCHGDVIKTKFPILQILNKETPQTMGWCLSCHNTAHPTLAGKIWGPIRQTRGSSQSTPPTSKPDSTLKGSRDCLTCHK
jgi:hypothetical protein